MSAALEERLYRDYMEFFANAEKTRRWQLADLPWELADSCPRDADLARVAEAFCGVELYLPDYVAQGINVFRPHFGQAWFIANWGYEESKHALALREYLLRTQQRSDAELRDYERRIFAHRWTLPFATPREMTLYGALQEMTTFVSYKKQQRAAERAGDRLLAHIYRVIARDEMAHSGFYVRATRALLEEDADGTKADLAFVLRGFKMPAADFVPGWHEHVASMQSAGLDRAAFVLEVWLPLLKRLGLSRRDLPRGDAVRRA